MSQTLEGKRELLLKLRRESELGGGEARIKKQHEQGKYTARERIERLVDPGSFLEFDRFVIHKNQNLGLDNKFLGDGVITGIATINSQKVALFSQDFT
ncbi:MAG: carboxyl transferase domain-containing protein, partial [Bacteriovorax sp.]